MRTILTEQEIKQLISDGGSKFGKKSLRKAKEHQEELKQFYYDKHPELIFNEVDPILTPQKLTYFKKVWQNPTKSIISHAETHFAKIMGPANRIIRAEFGRDLNSATDYNQHRVVQYGGISDLKWWQEYGVKLILTEPNAVLLTTKDSDDNPFTILVHLESIFDIHADHSGIHYIIFVEKRKDDKGKEFKLYYYYDDENFWIFREEGQGLTVVTEVVNGELVFATGKHGFFACPANFLYPEDRFPDNHIIKKSPLTDSIELLYEYSIWHTFIKHYKYFGAFGKEVTPEKQCSGFRNEGGDYCTGGMYYKGEGAKPTNCTMCKNKNKGLMGEVDEIPINQQRDASGDFADWSRVFFRVDPDHNVLIFQKKDLEDSRQLVLDNILGQGFGQNRDGVVGETATRVRASFEGQEDTLNEVKTNVQDSWRFTLTAGGYMWNSNTFTHANVFLTNKFFLKSVSEQIEEYGELTKVTSNAAVLQQKQLEIVMSQHRNDEALMSRFEIVKVLQPYSLLNQEIIRTDTTLNPTLKQMNQQFPEILGEWELDNGPVEANFMMTNNKSALLDKVRAELFQILDNYNEQTNGSDSGSL